MRTMHKRRICFLVMLCLVLGSLCLSGNTAIIAAETVSDGDISGSDASGSEAAFLSTGSAEDADLINYDFEKKTTADVVADWAFKDGKSGATATVETINGNNVLFVEQAAAATSGSNATLRYMLGETGYDNVVLSYSIAPQGGTGALYGPAPARTSTGGARNAEISLISGSIRDKSVNQSNKLVMCDTMTWYTVKIVYTKGSDDKYSYSVYVNGKAIEENVVPADNKQLPIYGVSMELYKDTAGAFYIDNIRMTTEDHEPVVPAALTTAPSEIPEELVQEDFEEGTTLPTGWIFYNNNTKDVDVEIQTINDNNVLVLTQNSGNASNNATLRYVLDSSYDDVVLSYSIASGEKTGIMYGPTVSGSTGGVRNAELALYLCEFRNKVDGTWNTISTEICETMTWYTVKMVYKKGSDGNYTYDVYVNDTLLTKDAAADKNQAVGGINIELYRPYHGIFYIDNIHMTTNDHTPVKPAELILPDIAGVTFAQESISLPTGGHVYLNTTVTPSNAENQEICFSSSDSNVVTVDEWGEIVAVNPGNAVITVSSAKDETIKDTIDVTVTEEPAVTKQIYAAVDGDAANDGSSATAPVTLEKAMEMVRSLNDTMTGNIEVILADGYYRLDNTLTFTEEDGGKNHCYVICRHEGDGEAVIGGGRSITGFSLYDETANIYVADAAGIQTRQLFVDGVRAVRARSEGALTDAVKGTDGITCSNTELLDYKSPADLEMVFQQEWTQPRCGVASIESSGEGKVKLVMDQPGWQYVTNKNQTSATIPVYYENALELLDEPGEWYLDETEGKLYYMPRPWEDLDTAVVTAPVLEELITIAGTDYDNPVENIRFEGITFADTTWMQPSTSMGHPDVQNNAIRINGSDTLPDSAITVSRANSISFTDCTFTRIGITALGMNDGVQNSPVTGCHFYDISGTAIQVGDSNHMDQKVYNPDDIRGIMKNCDVSNNYIHDIGVDYKSAAAVGVGFVADSEFTYNEIFNIPYSAFHIGYGWNIRFENILKNLVISHNFIHDLMGDGIYDGGAIYTLGNSGGDAESYNLITENYIKNQMERTGVLYSDNGSTYYEWSRNVVDLSETVSWGGGIAPRWAFVNSGSENVRFKENYTTTANYGVSSLVTDLESVGIELGADDIIVVEGTQWNSEAQAIIDASGLGEAYAGLRNNQAERITTNLPEGNVILSGEESFQINVSLTDGRDQSVTGGEGKIVYAMDDTDVAVVSDTGLITGVGTGKTTLRVYCLSNGILDVTERDVYIDDAPEAVALEGVEDTVFMSMGAAGKQLTAYVVTALGRELAAADIEYVIADTSIAAVDEQGYITPVEEGETTLTVTATAEEQTISTQFKVEITPAIEFLEDNVWEIFDEAREAEWARPSSAAWELVDDTSITTTINGFATFTGKEYQNELMSFTLKVDKNNAGSWPAIVFRAQSSDNYVAGGATGYILCMGESGIELHRYIGKMRHQIYGNVAEGEWCTNICKQGAKITDSPWSLGEEHRISVGALTDGGNVRILIKIDGETVIDYLDEEANGAITEPGYFGIIGRGETFTLTKNTAIADEQGSFINTTDEAANYLQGTLTDRDSSLKNKILSEEDKAVILAGKNIHIYLEIRDINTSVSAEDKTLIAEKLGNSKVGAYLDISLYKEIDGKKTAVTETNAALKLSLKIPTDLLNDDEKVTRSYGIICVHEGKAAYLNSTFDAKTGLITTATDSFSTYALVYTDVTVEAPTPTPEVDPTPTPEVDSNPGASPTPTPGTGGSESGGGPSAPDTGDDSAGASGTDYSDSTESAAGSTPLTGDDRHLLLWSLLLFMAFAAVLVLLRYRKCGENSLS